MRAQSGSGVGGDGARISALVGVAVGDDDTALASALAEIPRCRTKRNRKVRAHRKEQKKRSAAFANWLFATFSREVGAGRSALAMARQPRVVDVAGGSGGLCWEVATTHGARCTVIDPQPLRFGAAKTGALIGRLRSGGDDGAAQSSNGGGGGGNASSASSAGAGAAVDGPAAKRARVAAPRAARVAAGAAAAAAVDGDEAVEVAWLDAKIRARLPAPTRAKLAALLRNEIGIAQHRDLFDVAFAQRSAAFAEADLVTGLHPDQATDAIVDAALRAGKPFAVVPCCVFPALFAARRRRSGAAVRTLDDLCAYLCEKAVPPRFGGEIVIETVAAIPPPCNHVVWWRPLRAARPGAPRLAPRTEPV